MISETELPPNPDIQRTYGLFIVLLAGALTSLPPAKNVAYTITPGGQPDRVFQPADDLIVALSIKPNQPGANLFFVEVSNTRQPPPGEILRVIAVLTYLDLDIGITRQDAEFVEKKTGIYTYRMGGSHLTQPGRWKIEILVRRKGLPDSQAVFSWTVMPLGEIPPVVLSRFPWRNTLAMVAGLIAAIVIIPTGLSLLKQKGAA